MTLLNRLKIIRRKTYFIMFIPGLLILAWFGISGHYVVQSYEIKLEYELQRTNNENLEFENNAPVENEVYLDLKVLENIFSLTKNIEYKKMYFFNDSLIFEFEKPDLQKIELLKKILEENSYSCNLLLGEGEVFWDFLSLEVKI